MQPNATIITIGDEILIGQVVDTNSAFIGSLAADSGVRIRAIISISDSLSEITRTLDEAFSLSDIVIVTGGLGPTKDDITKTALCQYFEMGLRRDMPTYECVGRMLEKRGVEFNSLNESQADIPSGFTALRNPIGTAPGLFYDNRGKLLFCLPGVPFEMKQLFTQEVLPLISSHFELSEVVRHTVMVFGIPESELAAKISHWEDSLGGDYSLAYLPNPSGIRLRLSCRASGYRDVILGYILSKFKELEAIIPEYYLGDEGTSVVGEVARLLSERGESLSVAESCSGGAIASKCTSLSGASVWFKGGVVSYSNYAKEKVLGVESTTLETYGAVSAETVKEMAEGCLSLMNSDYAIATSGIAGPTGATATKAIGDVYIALSVRAKDTQQIVTETYFRNFGAPRHVFVERLTSAALNYLRLHLLKK